MMIQKAKHLYQELDKKKPACLTKRYALFEKYDGWFGYIDLDGTADTGVTSRAHRAIPALMDVSEALCLAAAKLPHGRLIFEVTLSDVKDFSTLNGILNRSKAPCQAPNVVLKCHDFIINENHLFESRYQDLRELISNINLPWVQLAPILKIGTYRDAQALAVGIWQANGEGVILKQVDAPYYGGSRNSTLLKIKEDVDADLHCIGTYPGKGKYLGMMGGLILVDKEGVEHRVSGMSDKQRAQPDLFVGKIVEIKAMKKLKDGQYREPRFKAIRHDKTVADID